MFYSFEASINNLCSFLRTKEEQEEMLECIGKMEGDIYSSRTAGENITSVEACGRIADRFGDAVSRLSVDMDKGALGKFLSLLKKKTLELKILRLELAYKPDEGAIEKFYSWVLNELGKGIVLDISINPAIVGGASVIYQGKYKEYTLNYLIDKVFEGNKESIMNPVIHRPVKKELPNGV